MFLKRLFFNLIIIVFAFTNLAMTEPPFPSPHLILIKGKVMDRITKKPIIGAMVFIRSIFREEESYSTITDKDGIYKIEIPGNRFYLLKASREGYLPQYKCRWFREGRTYTINFRLSDKTPPQGSVLINEGTTYTNSLNVTLQLSASDLGSGMQDGKMSFSNDNENWSMPEIYGSEKTWTLMSGIDGERTVYVRFQDSAHNWTKETILDTIVLDTIPPEKPEVTDDGDKTQSMTELHANWSSSDLTSGIAEYQYAIGRSCGSNNVVDWTSSGINTEITHRGLSLIPPQTYYFSVKAKDKAGNWSEIGCSDGIEIIADLPPKITQVLPLSESAFLAGSQIKIEISATDEEPQTLEYQFSIAGEIKRSWSLSSSYTWSPTPQDVGNITLLCEVRDSQGQKDFSQFYLSIINPTLEEVIQRVSNNYNLIQDMTAQMELSSELNGKPFGKRQYYRYYFKAPDKQKIITYADENRDNPVEITIIDGPQLFTVDPSSKQVREVNLLSESGLSQTGFNQLDLLYNPAIFMQSHNLNRMDNVLDLTKGMVNLVAIPKVESRLYSSLRLKIDYFRGLLVESQLYRDKPAPLQTTQTLEFCQMPNYAWVPVTILETSNLSLSSSNLVTRWKYSDIKINLGLTNEEFSSQ